MPTYVTLADVADQQFQNAQELATIWGNIRNDVDRLGGEVVDSYALLGEADFLVVVHVDDDDDALQIAMAMERYGLDTRTMRGIPVDRLGDLVDDI